MTGPIRSRRFSATMDKLVREHFHMFFIVILGRLVFFMLNVFVVPIIIQGNYIFIELKHSLS